MAQTSTEDRVFERELTALIPALRAFGRSLSGSAAEGDDLAQDTLAAAWHARDRFTVGTNLKAWTFMILRNRFISDKRRAWRSSQLDPDVAAQTLVARDRTDGAMELDDVRRALRLLPLEQREALILVGAAGLPYDDASVVLGVPTGTIKSRVSRGRALLDRILDEGQLPADACPPHAAMAAIFADVEACRARAA